MKKLLCSLCLILFCLIIFGFVSQEPTENYYALASNEDVEIVEFELKYGDNVFKFDDKSIIKNETEISARFSKMGTYNKKLQIAKKIKSMGFDQSVVMNYMFFGLLDEINKIVDEIELEPRSAEMKFRNNKPFIEKEIIGKKVDVLELYNRMYFEFVKSNKIVIDVPVKDILPTVFSQDLEKFMSKRARFSTSITGVNQEGRKQNILVALSKFEGMRVEPGQKVSFNQVVGDTIPENGYALAKIIENGKFIDGYGGGVCQASTTLYNALLLAGVDVVEARQHSLRVGYVPPSFDAMVSYGTSDMVFENNTGSPIYISTYSNGYECGAFIYGEQKDYIVKRRTEILDKDENTPDNVNIKSRGFLEYYQNGDLIKTKRIRNDVYYFPKTE